MSRTTDEQIAEWRRHAETYPADDNIRQAVFSPGTMLRVLDALEAERDRADKAEADLKDIVNAVNHPDAGVNDPFHVIAGDIPGWITTMVEIHEKDHDEKSTLRLELADMWHRGEKRQEQSIRRLERLSKLRAELRWHRTTGNCEGNA